jgi:hypothetical protein
MSPMRRITSKPSVLGISRSKITMSGLISLMDLTALLHHSEIAQRLTNTNWSCNILLEPSALLDGHLPTSRVFSLLVSIRV